MMNINAAQNWQGRMLGRYRLINLLGQADKGDLWLAEDGQLRRQVTIKALSMPLHADQRWLAEFEQQLHAAATLDHPHILPIHDFSQQRLENGQVIAYLVTPFITSGTLLEHMRTAGGSLQPTAALAFLRQAGQAIDYAHSKQVLHGNVTPASMYLQNSWLYLADFGLARLFPNSIVADGAPVSFYGTPEYIAREQAQGHAEPASDRYSLAVCAYQLLTGRLPFAGDAPLVLQKQAQETPPRPRLFNSAMPLPIEQALLWGLAKRPSDRPATCRALVDALEGNWLQNNAARVDGEGTYLAPWSKRLREQPAPAPSAPISPNAMTYATDRPYAPDAPTSLSSVPNTPAIPAAPAPLYAPGATNVPTYISGTPPASALAPTSPSKQRKVSRRALLIGGTGAAVALAGGGTLLYYLHRGTITNAPPHHQGQTTPTPAPGPQKLIEGIPVLSLTGHSKSVWQVAWDKTGRYLATGSEDTYVMLWDVGSILKKGATTLQALATPLRKWKLPKPIEANCLCWSADGRTLAAVVLDQNIYLINTASSAPATTLRDTSQQNNFETPFYANIAWSPTSAYFVTNDLNTFKTEVGLWQYGRSTSPQILSFHDANSSQSGAGMDFVSWSSDGKLLAGHTSAGEVAIWDMATKQVSQVITMADRLQYKGLIINNECLAWSPVEQVLAASDYDYTYIWDVKNNKQLLTLQVNEPLLLHDIHPPYVWNMTWSPNGRYLALCYPRSPRIYIWDIQALRGTTAPTKPVSQTLLFPQRSISNGRSMAHSTLRYSVCFLYDLYIFQKGWTIFKGSVQ